MYQRYKKEYVRKAFFFQMYRLNFSLSCNLTENYFFVFHISPKTNVYLLFFITYFRLRFGLAKAIDTYFRGKLRE